MSSISITIFIKFILYWLLSLILNNNEEIDVEKIIFIKYIKKISNSKLNNWFVLFDKKDITLNSAFSKFTKDTIYQKFYSKIGV